jgi:hypothetical protein
MMSQWETHTATHDGMGVESAADAGNSCVVTSVEAAASEGDVSPAGRGTATLVCSICSAGGMAVVSPVTAPCTAAGSTSGVLTDPLATGGLAVGVGNTVKSGEAATACSAGGGASEVAAPCTSGANTWF